ncbi:MAG: MFS transporter [Gammaproteobacteria bacterium]|nr:MFS transporter [Gammaproteobacteria bacterium]
MGPSLSFGYASFAGLFFVGTLARAMLISVLPLQALALLGDAQKVSVLYFSVSVGGILASLLVPAIVRAIGCYQAFLLSMMVMALSALLLWAGNNVWLFIIGMFCHVFAIASMEISLSLYIMRQIARGNLTRFEPLRIMFTVLALAIGPWLGVYLESRVAHWIPYAITVVSTVATVIYFRLLGLHKIAIGTSLAKTVNPLRYMGRYFRQPRLRLAWGLILGRAAWWTMFVIYTPIYAQRAGLGELVGAAVVSIGTAWTLTVPFWGWVGRQISLRRLLMIGFFITGVMSLFVFAFASNPWAASTLLIFAALGATILDGGGNVLFFRAVRPLDRSEMTGVFLTYRDSAQLAAPGLFAILLKFFALPIVFASSAAGMFVCAYYSRYVPRRM